MSCTEWLNQQRRELPHPVLKGTHAPITSEPISTESEADLKTTERARRVLRIRQSWEAYCSADHCPKVEWGSRKTSRPDSA
jgi:hypothetical protein